MSKRLLSPSSASPLTFELPLELIARIEKCREFLGLGSASEVVRAAVERFDFVRCQPVRVPQKQISVRLSATQRTTLKKQARLKKVSVGELLRLAIEDLPLKKAGAKKTAPKAKTPVKKKRR